MNEPFWALRLPVVSPSQVSVGGSSCTSLRVFRDDRGYLFETIRQGDTPVAMSYVSLTKPGCARDLDQWHQHPRQMDHFVVLNGMALFALAQTDPPLMQQVILSMAEPFLLTIPPGVFHCLRTVGETALLVANYPDQEYDPQEELRMKFTDVGLFPWGEPRSKKR